MGANYFESTGSGCSRSFTGPCRVDGSDVESFNEHRKRHCCVYVALRDVLTESFNNQGKSNEKQKCESQHLHRWVAVDEGINRARRRQHDDDCRHDRNDHHRDVLVMPTAVNTESSENTTSSNMTCAMTAPNVNTAFEPWASSSPSSFGEFLSLLCR